MSRLFNPYQKKVLKSKLLRGLCAGLALSLPQRLPGVLPSAWGCQATSITDTHSLVLMSPCTESLNLLNLDLTCADLCKRSQWLKATACAAIKDESEINKVSFWVYPNEKNLLGKISTFRFNFSFVRKTLVRPLTIVPSVPIVKKTTM